MQIINVVQSGHNGNESHDVDGKKKIGVKMKQNIKTALSVLGKNWTTLLLFEIFFKIFSFSLIYAGVDEIIHLILRVAGVSYISFENIYQIIKNPVSIILILTILFIIILSVFYEVTAIFLCFEKGWLHEKIYLWRLLKESFLKCIKICRIQNFIVFLGFVMIIPVAVIPLTNNLIGWIRVPEFIMEYLTQNRLMSLLFLGVLLALHYIYFLYLFGMPSLIIENMKFRASWKTSLALLKNRKIKTIGRLAAAILVYLAIIGVVAVIGTVFLWCHTRLQYPSDEAADVFRFMFPGWRRVGIILAGSSAAPWLFAVILTQFHEYRGDIRPSAMKRKWTFISIARNIVMFAAAVFTLTLYSETELGGNVIYNNQNTIEVVAHRAGAASAPENTLAALKTAVSMKADSAEIDIQQLRDGTLVVMHDSNFRRTTGINRAVWEVDYSDVKDYDAGSAFSAEYKNEPVPLLEDLLSYAENKIKLMIELKLTGHEHELEKTTVELIGKYNMENQCSIASMNLAILEKVKKLNPRIETIYITPVLIADSLNIDFVDSYSVETTSLSRELVVNIQFQGKKVYGWTANSKKTIKKNIWLGVNGIITDEPMLALELYHE